jgi:hypothetical protein
MPPPGRRLDLPHNRQTPENLMLDNPFAKREAALDADHRCFE